MSKILIADSLSPSIISDLEHDGHTITYTPTLTTESLIAAITAFEILIVRSTRVTRAVISAADSLTLIIRAGAGYDTIDVEAATENGILVTNTPGCNSNAVAELAIGHLLACDRHIVDNAEHLRSGEWRKGEYLECPGLRGRVLGVIGAGQIARRVIRIAQAMGMQTACCAPELNDTLAAELQVRRVDNNLELARISHAVSVHIPYLPETHHCFSTEFFNALPAGAIFVNTSRGQVVDTPALVEAIRTKQLRVGLDVYENEPDVGDGPFEDSELAGLLASCTCHIGGSTEQASEAVGLETLNIVRTFVRDGKALNCVNLDAKRNMKQGVMKELIIAVRHQGVMKEIRELLEKNRAVLRSVTDQAMIGGMGQLATLKIQGNPDIEFKIKAIEGVISVSVKVATE